LQLLDPVSSPASIHVASKLYGIIRHKPRALLLLDAAALINLSFSTLACAVFGL
jgi:hypothetical protein